MIRFISHRGNLNGPNPSRENNPEYVDEAIKAGHHVEIDLRCVGSDWYLGHDYPQYRVNATWLFDREQNLLMHLKDWGAVKNRVDSWHTFCHTSDPFAITSVGYIWLHDLSLPPTRQTIIPLMTKELIMSFPKMPVLAICSDYEVDGDGDLVTRGTL